MTQINNANILLDQVQKYDPVSHYNEVGKKQSRAAYLTFGFATLTFLSVVTTLFFLSLGLLPVIAVAFPLIFSMATYSSYKNLKDLSYKLTEIQNVKFNMESNKSQSKLLRSQSLNQFETNKNIFKYRAEKIILGNRKNPKITSSYLPLQFFISLDSSLKVLKGEQAFNAALKDIEILNLHHSPIIEVL